MKAAGEVLTTSAVLGRASAAFLLVLLCPLLCVFAVLIKVQSPGPIFFGQLREGRAGRPFRLWKLRTMVIDADIRFAQSMRDRVIASEWNRYGFLKNDTRIVGWAGRVMRQYSIDELPQLWNVVRGEMTLVGPRPLPLNLAESLDPADRSLRNSVCPGLTGLWQVRRRSEVDIRGMQRYDRLYIRKRSRRLDLLILITTPAAVLSRRGAF
jgi:exopolysaccharide production protein ExoY